MEKFNHALTNYNYSYGLCILKMILIFSSGILRIIKWVLRLMKIVSTVDVSIISMV